jgi:hypothetical protein
MDPHGAGGKSAQFGDSNKGAELSNFHNGEVTNRVTAVNRRYQRPLL